MMILLFLLNFILPSSNAINETDTRKFCFLPAASTVPRQILTTTNALSLPGCHVPCALNANCQACSYNAATLKCTLLGPTAAANSCSEPYTAYEKHTTGCTDIPIPHSNASYTLSKCLNASDVIGPPPFVRVSPVCGNATANLRRVAYDTILHDGTRWVLENHRDSFIDWDEKIGSWYFNIGVAVYYFYAATCVKVPATQLPSCGCAALASEPAMAGYVTTGVAAATEQPPPVCAGQVQFRISRASAPSASQTVMNGAYRSIYCAMGTWMQIIDNGSSWYNEWSLSTATSRKASAQRTRRISEPSLDPETREDAEPAHLTVQGLPSRRKNSTLSISSVVAPSRKATTRQAKFSVPDDVMPARPEDYMRYLSNLSTVTVTNNGREFRDVPAYLQQFEMSRRGTMTTTMSQPVRRRMSVVQEPIVPLQPIPEAPEKPPNKIKKAVVSVISKHRAIGLRHILLALALAVYAVAGMFIFHAIEVPFERKNVMATRDALNDAFKILAHDLEIASKYPSANTTLLLKKAYLTLIKIDGKYTGSTFYKLEERDYPLWTWTYGTSYFFAFTLYSTVGYGSIAPSTELGRIAVIPYTALGFPFALVIVRDLGSVLLVYITRAYARLVLKIRQAGGFEPAPSDEGIRLPMKVAFLISFSYAVLTALFVRAYDAWLGPDPGLSMFHAFYFTFLSYAAVGLGDIMPVNYAHAPLIAIVLLCGMPMMRVINRVLYVGIEHRMFGTVSIVEDALDRIAPDEREDGLNTVAEMVENGGGNSLSTLDEDYSEDEEEEDEEEREENRIHNELKKNFTVHPSSAISPQNVEQTK